jgi:hypothetical protein
MALKKIYALFDKTVNAYYNPLVFTNDGEAIRWFTTIVNRRSDENNIYTHYVDYSLHSLGDLDDKSGELLSKQRKLIEGAAVKEEEVQYTLDDLFERLQGKQQ